MQRIWRTMLFLVFAAGFLISAPLVVLYTAGYRYDFNAKHVVKSGVVSIASVPKGATIFLNDKEQEKKTPIVIDTVTPGPTTIRLEKDGYTSWVKTLPVTSGQTTFVPNARLYLTSAPTAYIDTKNVSECQPYSTNRFAYITKEKAATKLWIHDENGAQERLVHQERLKQNTEYTMSWSADGTYLLLSSAQKETNTFTLIRAFDGKTITLPIQHPTNVWFDPTAGHVLKIKEKANLTLFGIDTEPNQPTTFTADDATWINGQLTAIQTANQSTLSTIDNQGIASIQMYLPKGTYRFLFAPNPYIFVEDTSRHHMILLNQQTPNTIVLNQEMRLIAWSPKKDRLLFSNGFDINLFTLESNQLETIRRFSEPVESLAWHPAGNDLIYTQGGSIHALEVDKRNTRNETSLVTPSHTKQLWLDKDGSSLFYCQTHKEETAQTIYQKLLQK